MEMKELAEAVEKKNKPVEEAGESTSFQLSEDSSCIKDIDDICSLVNGFISKSFLAMANDLENKISTSDKHSIILCCNEAISVMEAYKNARLNVEFSRRIKFELRPGAAQKR